MTDDRRELSSTDIFDRLRRSDLTGIDDVRLQKLARLLKADRFFEAVFLAGLFGREQIERGQGSAQKANFNPLEPRDGNSRWTRTSGTDDIGGIHDVAYRGYFHDLVVDDLLEGLKSTGSKVMKNVSVLGLNGAVAIPDGAARPKEWSVGYFIEVKTGAEPPFTENQNRVYPLICVGGHATSADPRIKELGLTPGVPFPPMKIMLVYTRGPGLPLHIKDYCEELGIGVK